MSSIKRPICKIYGCDDPECLQLNYHPKRLCKHGPNCRNIDRCTFAHPPPSRKKPKKETLVIDILKEILYETVRTRKAIEVLVDMKTE